MTRITFFVAAALMLISTSQSFGQLKIAHINTNNLIATMPEADSANAQLQALNQQLVRTGEELQVEYRKAYLEYEQQMDTLSNLVRQTKEAALTDMGQRIQEFGQNSQQELTKTQEALFQPILVKAQNAIQAVAEEQGYDYVLDTGTGAVLTIPKDESWDILKLVQTKLGIKVD